MKSLKALFLLAILMALAVTLSATSSDGEEEEEQTSLRGTNQFLAHLPSRVVVTCGNKPSVCLVESSPGPDCCNNKCVNLQTDAFNCGRCGKKCSYKKICCNGKCVNPMTNEKHCGKCGNKCNKGSSCVYGMCSYA